jgi:anti-sigma regulatory factor (Ser/Thr protein kinase)
VDLTAYRIVQEALTNTVKHSGADEAAVIVRYEPGYVTVSVTDAGDEAVAVTPGRPGQAGRARPTGAGPARRHPAGSGWPASPNGWRLAGAA